MSISHDYIDTNGIKLHAAFAGPKDGQLVLLLHGFPEFWYGWSAQILALAAAGFRVVAPDLRGYNLSDKPKGIANYSTDVLSDDVAGLVDALGEKQAIIVGHDWGAVVAWRTANTHPEIVKKLVILNVPHPVVMRRTLMSSWHQRKKSWYIFFFQLPFLPEWLYRRNNWSVGIRTLKGTSRHGTFSDEDLKAYRTAWGQPQAIKSMINWYRAAARVRPRRVASHRVLAPTLIIWGKLDKFLGWEMVEPSLELCENGRVEYLDDATHWLAHEEPERISELIIEFIHS